MLAKRVGLAGLLGSIGLLTQQAHAAAPSPFEKSGVFVWGDNSEQLVTSDKIASVRVPTRIAMFDNVKLRSLAVGPKFGLAALANGDVVQFSAATSSLKSGTVLKGQNAKKVCVSPQSNMALALTKGGAIFSWESGAKPSKLSVKLGWFERIDDISVGVDHLLAKTNKGRVFTASLNAQVQHYGQFGMAQFSHFNGPPPPLELHEIKLLPHSVNAIACGKFHSLFLTAQNELWGCGSNLYGQLMLPFTFKNQKNSVPVKLRTDIRSIAAGSDVSFFELANSEEWKVAGNGEFGQFGTGSFAQCQLEPVSVRALAGLREFDETTNQVVSRPVDQFEIGATHVFAAAGGRWLSWGSNERGQLGNGKLSKIVKPTPVTLSENFVGSDGYDFVAGDKVSACYVRA